VTLLKLDELGILAMMLLIFAAVVVGLIGILYEAYRNKQRVRLVKSLLQSGIDACFAGTCIPGCIFCRRHRETNDTVKSDVGGLSRGVQGTTE
jgi:hypothetical protein